MMHNNMDVFYFVGLDITNHSFLFCFVSRFFFWGGGIDMYMLDAHLNYYMYLPFLVYGPCTLSMNLQPYIVMPCVIFLGLELY